MLILSSALLSWAPSSNVPAAVRATAERAAVRCQAYDPEVGGLSQEETAQLRPEGSHGTGYRFMPVSALTDVPSPVLLPIAGMHPGLTVDQLAAPQPLPMPEQGKWIYHRLVGDAVPTGFVALPGSEPLIHCPDAVAVVCTCVSLGLELADGKVLPRRARVGTARQGHPLCTPRSRPPAHQHLRASSCRRSTTSSPSSTAPTPSSSTRPSTRRKSFTRSRTRTASCTSGGSRRSPPAGGSSGA
jgi:hypothetical protein